jgi:hypothetical protein
MVIRARAFLAAYRESCNITKSAKAAGVGVRQHYRWLEKYPKYRAAFERAQVVAAQWLEDKAVEGATDGWLEPVFYQGMPVGAVRRFDLSMRQFLLRGAKPDKYRQSAELTGPGGGPIEAKLEVVFVGSPKAEPTPAPAP